MPDVLLMVLAVLALIMESAVQLLFWRKEDKKLSIGVQTAYFAVLLLPAISLLLPHFSRHYFCVHICQRVFCSNGYLRCRTGNWAIMERFAF